MSSSSPFIAGSHRRVAVLAGLIIGIVLLALFVPGLGFPSATVASITKTATVTPSPVSTETAPAPTASPTLPPSATALPTLVPTEAPTLAATATPESQDTQPQSQPATPSPESISAATPPTDSEPALQANVLSSRYSLAGTPTEGCGKFNAQKISRRFDVQIQITNLTGQDLASDKWGAAAYSGQQTALLCYFEGQGTLPPLIANNPVTVVLTAFVPSGQDIDTLLIGTASGKVTKLCFLDGKSHAC